MKNIEDSLIILNKITKAVIEQERGKHPKFLFVYRGKPVTCMSRWRTASKKVGLDIRVHDLRHTFGRRLRTAGVSFEDRQDPLGHKSTRITTHYSAAELENLLDAANSICGNQEILRPLSPASVFTRYGE